MKLENIGFSLNTLDDKSYIFMLVAYHTAPTIAKVKPSSLVIFKRGVRRDLCSNWEKYKYEITRSLNIDFYELKRTEKSIHVLFYNHIKLHNVLTNSENMAFLNRFGYLEAMNTYELLKLLKKRYEHACPHEIGIFLGYPISDVVDFIECPDKACLARGYWKVYNDLEKAKEIFASYDKAKNKVVYHIAERIRQKRQAM